jgi:integrase
MSKRVKHLMVDRFFRGVGRIHRSLETTVRREADRRERVLLTLYDHGRLDILKGIKTGRLSVTAVADAFKRNALDSLPTAGALVPLAPAIEEWLSKGRGSRKPLRPATIKNYKQVWSQAIGSGVFGINPTVADVSAENVEEFREQLLGAGHAPQANRFWSAAKSFLGRVLGRRHPQVLAVQDLDKYPEPKTVRLPVEPDAFWSVHEMADGAIQPALVALTVTGMMPSELERLQKDDLFRDTGWVRVPGEKTDNRARLVGVPEWAWDDIVAATPWTMDRSRFQKLLVKAAKNTQVPWFRLYDLRRAFSRWHEAAGTPQSRIEAYMGHTERTITDRYLRTEIEPYAREDAERMGEYLRGQADRAILRVVR